MTATSALIVTVFRHMRRDRSIPVFLVALPIGLMVLLGNIYAAQDTPVPQLGILVDGHDDTTDAIAELLESSEAVEVREIASRAALDDAVRRRRIDAGLVLHAGRAAELIGPPDVALPGGVQFVVRGVVSRVDQATGLAAQSPDATLSGLLDQFPPPSPVPMASSAEARTQAAIGVLVLATFMNLIAYGSMVPNHRSLGVLRRMGAAPVSTAELVGAYAVGFVVVAATQVAIALVTGRVLLGISWGPTGQLVVISAALAVSAGGVAALAGTLLPTPESGSSLGGPVGFVLGMLGGCLWPLEIVGPILHRIGQWIPHQWAVAALQSVADGTATAAELAPRATGLILVGLAAGRLGARRLRSEWD